MGPVGPGEMPPAAESTMLSDIGDGAQLSALPGLMAPQQGVDLLQSDDAQKFHRPTLEIILRAKDEGAP